MDKRSASSVKDNVDRSTVLSNVIATYLGPDHSVMLLYFEAGDPKPVSLDRDALERLLGATLALATATADGQAPGLPLMRSRLPLTGIETSLDPGSETATVTLQMGAIRLAVEASPDLAAAIPDRPAPRPQAGPGRGLPN